MALGGGRRVREGRGRAGGRMRRPRGAGGVRAVWGWRFSGGVLVGVEGVLVRSRAHSDVGRRRGMVFF